MSYADVEAPTRLILVAYRMKLVVLMLAFVVMLRRLVAAEVGCFAKVGCHAVRPIAQLQNMETGPAETVGCRTVTVGGGSEDGRVAGWSGDKAGSHYPRFQKGGTDTGGCETFCLFTASMTRKGLQR